jgi:U6 snRNA-associated Sm-like protein LSm5
MAEQQLKDPQTESLDSSVDPKSINATTPSPAESMTLPLELIDQCVGKRIKAFLRDHHVFEGTLVGFDDLVNLVLDDVVEPSGAPNTVPTKRMLLSSRSLTMIAPLE